MDDLGAPPFQETSISGESKPFQTYTFSLGGSASVNFYATCFSRNKMMMPMNPHIGQIL